MSQVECQTGKLLDCAKKRSGFSFPAVASRAAFIQYQIECFDHSVYEFLTHATCPAQFAVLVLFALTYLRKQ
jgi:hypothetical protein